jgi:hypothetical protein
VSDRALLTGSAAVLSGEISGFTRLCIAVARALKATLTRFTLGCTLDVRVVTCSAHVARRLLLKTVVSTLGALLTKVLVVEVLKQSGLTDCASAAYRFASTKTANTTLLVLFGTLSSWISTANVRRRDDVGWCTHGAASSLVDECDGK